MMNSSFFKQPDHCPEPITVAIVGATGLVGQRLLALCQQIPWINVVEISASSGRKGQVFADVCPWRDPNPMPNHLGSRRFCDMEDVSAPYILSCLPNDVAQKWEPIWAKKGHLVFSNASAFRMESDVPLLVPEVNRDHMSIGKNQKSLGKIITNPNCSATGLALALAPILRIGRPKHISIVTLQSISGAGYPGLSSMDILGNTIPNIPGEAQKIEQELGKILGTPTEPLTLPITVNVHRVPVLYGHVASIHILWHQSPVSDWSALYRNWNQYLGHELFVLHAGPDRPQTRLDLSTNDMRVHIGPMETHTENPVLRFNILSHNLVRGAAGAVLANLKCFLETTAA